MSISNISSLALIVEEDGMTHFEAFQVTDQCMKLYSADLFRPSKDPKVCKFGEQVLMHRAGAGRKESDEVETTVLLKPVCFIVLLHTAQHVITQHTGCIEGRVSREVEHRIPHRKSTRRAANAGGIEGLPDQDQEQNLPRTVGRFPSTTFLGVHLS